MVDDPIYFAPLIKKLKRQSIKIIAMCHNIETLSQGQTTVTGQRILLNKELDVLSRCDLLMVISREECFFLNNLNIKAIFFPYYPADVMLERLLTIRANRRQTKKEGIILLGNAANAPTRIGMARVMKAWSEHDLASNCDTLVVAGYGTEVLRDMSIGAGIEFLGPLTNEEFEKTVSVVEACLCYQEKGSGALTRIADMLVAGVPVLANAHAARSYYNVQGVTEFSNFAELPQAMKGMAKGEGDIPIPAPPDLSLLLSQIRELIERNEKDSPYY
jgi:hypothetical protein